MNRKPFQSKKFIALSVAMTFTTIFTSISLLIIALVPAVSSAVVNLMTVTLASVNGAISIYALGQSAVDWKIEANVSSTQSSSHEVKETKISEYKEMEIEYEGEAPINWEENEKNLLII